MIKKLFNNKSLLNSFIYIATDVIQKAIPFLLLPVITRYLSPSDYAIVTIFISLISMFTIFIGLNAQSAIYANYFNYTKEQMQLYVSNVMVIIVISALLTLFITLLVHVYIEEWLHLGLVWIILAILYVTSQTIASILTIIWMLEGKAVQFGIYQISSALFLFSLTLLLVAYYDLSWIGQISAMITTSIWTLFISIYILNTKRYIKFKLDKESIRDALEFGIPLIPHSLGVWVKMNTDKLLVLFLIGSSSTGLFAIGYQLASIIMVVSVAVQKAWQPFLYKKLSSINSWHDKIRIVQLTYVLFFLLFIFSFLFYLISPYIVSIFLSSKFQNLNIFLGYLILSNVFASMSHIIIGYIMFTKQTKKLVVITMITASTHIFLSYIFIYSNGIVGAAQANAISFLITFLLTWYISSKVYPMPWRLRKLNI
jgi:O-antigen/teichoic acid export membrane protein